MSGQAHQSLPIQRITRPTWLSARIAWPGVAYYISKAILGRHTDETREVRQAAAGPLTESRPRDGARCNEACVFSAESAADSAYSDRYALCVAPTCCWLDSALAPGLRSRQRSGPAARLRAGGVWIRGSDSMVVDGIEPVSGALSMTNTPEQRVEA